MRAVGILAGMVVATFFLFMYLASGAGTEPIKDDMQYQRLAERIAPQAKVAVAGQDNTALNAGDTARAAPPPAAPAAVLTGEQVYSTTCIACHAAGVAGAPKFGDKGAWAPRLGQGLAVLHKHALEGFQGKAGVMPPKGGRVDLADQSIANAVDYMVNAAK
ncbi:MAG: cytochrome c5 family protein [Gammaproteobacteria bacterium]|nr:MAG: cytochrome c5 family protein [Gammaproteobacteria bacterium]TLZ20391.1 MAG: cytochrome c5 family protein [Gammaproteobacteria bacterium]TLZ27675.1 MAG: cytochrome c5 family protein [Gammaproteobacteria bacterium]TLZ31716.1 MAG: cytochrome c5 family protein [Gammaproteobacteria bacterium]TLZ48961.1 MAG: cytochrome c5 family protein [Gammaproteobacteria bacterium]